MAEHELVNQPIPPKSPPTYIRLGTKTPKTTQKSNLNFSPSKQGAYPRRSRVIATGMIKGLNSSSFVQIGPKLTEFELLNQSHFDTSSAAMTSGGPQNTLRGPQNTSDVEPYVENWHKIGVTPKTTIKESSENLRKTPSPPPPPPSSLLPLDLYHGPDPANTTIAAPTAPATTDVNPSATSTPINDNNQDNAISLSTFL